MLQTTIEDTAAFFARTILNKRTFDVALGKLRQWWEDVLTRPTL
jgi:hypothetical protein